MGNISGKKILITGGSSGIGKATAKKLVKKGAIVSITGRDNDKLDRIASEINAIPIHLDVSKYNTIAVKTLDAFHSMGGIDVLINNATKLISLLKTNGILILSGILNYEAEDVSKAFDKILDSCNFASKQTIDAKNEWCAILYKLI